MSQTDPTTAASPLDLQTHDIMAAALQERGLITAEQAAVSRITLESGQSTTDAPAPAPPATAPQEPASLDSLAFAPAVSPAEYTMQHGEPPAGVIRDLEFEQTNREALLHAGIPTSIGTHIAKLWHEAQFRDQPITDEELHLSKSETFAALQRVWGDDTTANLQLANTVVDRLAERQPQVRELLVHSGLGNNSWLIETFYNLARAQQGRR
jgi:hypothetical protein